MIKKIIENIIGLVFIGSAIAKLLDFNNTVQFLITIPGLNFQIAKTALIALSLLEIFIGFCFFINVWKNQTIFYVIITTVAFFVCLNIYFFFKGYANCGCFGTQIISSPLASLIKNIIICAYLLYAKYFQNNIKHAVL